MVEEGLYGSIYDVYYYRGCLGLEKIVVFFMYGCGFVFLGFLWGFFVERKELLGKGFLRNGWRFLGLDVRC